MRRMRLELVQARPKGREVGEEGKEGGGRDSFLLSLSVSVSVRSNQVSLRG